MWGTFRDGNSIEYGVCATNVEYRDGNSIEYGLCAMSAEYVSG